MPRNTFVANVFAICAPLALVIVMASRSSAQTTTGLYTFTGGADGGGDQGTLVFDSTGNLYGATSAGGKGRGVVFKLSTGASGWTETVLYSFAGSRDGGVPVAGLVFDATGNLYGTTVYGGDTSSTACAPRGCGVVFELSPGTGGTWTETVLHTFHKGTMGGYPESGLTFDAAGNLYGTTFAGGDTSKCAQIGCGVVYRLSPIQGGWAETVLHTFTGGADGDGPLSGVIFDAAGNLYTETYQGGVPNCSNGSDNGCGAIVMLSPSSSGPWKGSILHTFGGGRDGGNPRGGLAIDGSGNIYGTTVYYGGNTGCGGVGCGVVFELSPVAGGWKASLLHTFAGGAADGGNPSSTLLLDSSGNLYGTTWDGGSTLCGDGCGTAYKLSPSTGAWIETILHAFNSLDGQNLLAGLILDAQGSLYGATYTGGTGNNAFGTVFKITP